MLTLNRAGRHRAQATHVPAPALPPPTRCRLGPWSADETHSPRPSSLQLAPHSSTCTTARQPRKEARCSAPPLPRSPPASRASRVDCVSVRRGYVDARNRSFTGCPRLPLPVVPGTTTQCTAARTPFQTRASQLSFLIRSSFSRSDHVRQDLPSMFSRPGLGHGVCRFCRWHWLERTPFASHLRGDVGG